MGRKCTYLWVPHKARNLGRKATSSFSRTVGFCVCGDAHRWGDDIKMIRRMDASVPVGTAQGKEFKQESH